MLIEKRARTNIAIAKCECGSENIVLYEDYSTRGIKFSLCCIDCGIRTKRHSYVADCINDWNKRIKNDWYPLRKE